MRLQFDEGRAVQLFTILQDLWNRKANIFDDIVLPQDRWPVPHDPVQAANYLTCTAITQRGGVVSEDPFKWVNELRRANPELFDPFAVVDRWPVRRIMEVISKAVTDRKSWKSNKREAKQLPLFPSNKERPRRKQLPLLEVVEYQNTGTYKLDEFADSWRQNSLTLVNRFHGNPLEIFDGIEDFEEAFARIDYKNRDNRGKPTFSGIRRKIFSLLTIWLQEKALIPVFPTPVPIDFHALRLLFATQVVTAPDLVPFVVNPKIHPLHLAGRPLVRTTENITDQIAQWSQPFIAKHGFSHMAINPALWVLSRELCVHEFQNRGEGRGRVGSRRNIRLVYPEVLEARPMLWPIPYANPASVCPLARLCRLAIPSNLYYSFVLLALLNRVPYPHSPLVHIERTGLSGRSRNGRK